MRKLFLLSLLSLAVGLGGCKQGESSAGASASLPAYGIAYTWQMEKDAWGLILCNGVVPNPGRTPLAAADGEARHFADEAAVLNFLYAQGWEVLPNGIEGGNYRYLLKRRTP